MLGREPGEGELGPLARRGYEAGLKRDRPAGAAGAGSNCAC